MDPRARIAALFGGVTVVAAAVAWSANLLLGTLIALPEGAELSGAEAVAARVVSPPRPRALPLTTYLDGIMSRNLFDVNVISSWRPARSSSGDGLVSSDLKVRLLGTIVAQPEIYSSALIVEESTPDYARGYSIGDKLHDREIASIERRRVKLRAPDGTEEWLVVDADGLTAAAPSEVASGEPLAEGIEQVSENRYAVSREVFDKNINDLESISKMGRALLHRGPDGEFDGYRLSSIRRGSMAEQLGIKNGDVIHAVNGEPLSSMQGAMNAYNTMRGQSSFCFEVTRRGAPTELCYDVR